MEYELKPRYDNRKSFYGKASVKVDEDGTIILKSYNTIVAKIHNGNAKVTNLQSVTTLRHVKEFLKQNGFTADSKAQIQKDYM